MSRPFGSKNRPKGPKAKDVPAEKLEIFSIGDRVRVKGFPSIAVIEAFDSEYPDLAILSEKLLTRLGSYWVHNIRMLEKISF